jgi:nucleotide-binding universal stress UspA family protein
LIFLISGDPNLHVYTNILTPTVLVGVLFAELIGPACTKYALEKAGEAAVSNGNEASIEIRNEDFFVDEGGDVQLVPWSWEKLTPAGSPRGAIVFGVSHQSTVNGLARMATILAHHFKAQPVAVSIQTAKDAAPSRFDSQQLFEYAAQEAGSLGYVLHTSKLRAESVAKGIIVASREKRALAVLLGYPFHRTESNFNKIVEEVYSSVACPIVIVRFTGILHTERILVPIIHGSDLEIVADTLCALAHVGKHSITLLHLLSTEMQEQETVDYEIKLNNWAAGKNLPFVKCIATKTDARLETIIKEAQTHDLLVMAVPEGFGIKKMLLGSLADDVASNCQRPMLIVHHPRV